jgi:hypothetical protein
MNLLSPTNLYTTMDAARLVWGINAVWDALCVVGMGLRMAWVPHLRYWIDEEEREEVRGPAILLVGWWGLTRAMGALHWRFAILARASYPVETMVIGVLVVLGRVQSIPATLAGLLCLIMGLI